MPLSLPKLEQLTDGRWQATCRSCGWESYPMHYKAAVERARRDHGTEADCERRHGERR